MKKFKFLTICLAILAFSCAKEPHRVVVTISQEVKGHLDTTVVNAFDESLLYGDWVGVRLVGEERFDGELIKSEELSWGGTGQIISFHKDGTTQQESRVWTYQYNMLFFTDLTTGDTNDFFELVSVDKEKLIYRMEDGPYGSVEWAYHLYNTYHKDKSGHHLFLVCEYERLNN